MSEQFSSENAVNKKVLWLAGIALVLIGLLFYFYTRQAQTLPLPSHMPVQATEPLFEATMSEREKRTKLFDILERAETRPLSEEEKIQVLVEFGGERTAGYNFTADEKERILKILNQ